MELIRRYSLLVTACALAVAVMAAAVADRPAVSANAAASLTRAASYFDSTIVLARNARPRGLRGDQLAIGLGYLERLRLGLGSPFRLADEAMRDPRLDPAMASRVAWGVLARLRRGDAYVIDPAVLDWADAPTAVERATTGEQHVALIENAVRTASDPRAGELSVRLAYMISAAKGLVAQQSVSVAAQVAALARDRELAARDLRDLLADANGERADVLSLLTSRREMHSFRVEQPPLAPLEASLQTEAMHAVPAIVRALDTLDRVAHAAPAGARASLVNIYFADRLEDLGEDRPPLAQVAVTLRTRAGATISASNEETLIAGYARSATPEDDTTRRANALAMLSTAVAMRTLAQDAPWFPGDRGPDAADLTSEFGLADVVFSRAVPRVWRPYYLRELQSGFRDVQAVLPALSFAGLHVRIGADVLRDSALAMHDPRTRTLQLSIASSGGTLAHELSHDLDWQAARRLYTDGSGYSTDRAMREKTGTLASSLRSLAEARLQRPYSETTTPQAIGRPAEMFARGADWFITTALAQRGRTNGFLSVVGDAQLTGYAAGAPTAMGVAGAASLLSAIGQMTYLPDSVRNGFEAQWSDPSVVDPTMMLRRVLDAPVSLRLNGGSRALMPIVTSTRPAVCPASQSAEARARESLLMLAVDARVTGAAARRARFRYGTARPDWARSILGTAPWATEEGDRFRELMRSALLSELTSAIGDQGLVPLVPGVFCER